MATSLVRNWHIPAHYVSGMRCTCFSSSVNLKRSDALEHSESTLLTPTRTPSYLHACSHTVTYPLTRCTALCMERLQRFPKSRCKTELTLRVCGCCLEESRTTAVRVLPFSKTWSLSLMTYISNPLASGPPARLSVRPYTGRLCRSPVDLYHAGCRWYRKYRPGAKAAAQDEQIYIISRFVTCT